MPFPVDPAVILPFLAAVALMELTPGPNMGWLALAPCRRGGRRGWRRWPGSPWG